MHCFLHIGPTKTGSSSIQFFLKQNETSLAERGFCLPRISQMNAAEFAIAFSNNAKSNRAHARLGVTPENFNAKKQAFRRKFGRQIKSAKEAGAHSCIISAESLSQTGLNEGTAGEIARLAMWLRKRFDRISIIPVLRRQDQRAISGYKNQVKNDGFAEQNCLEHRDSLDLDRLLSSWAEEFGAAAMRPILFPASVEEDRDLIADFTVVCGIAGLEISAEPQEYHRNTAIDGRAIELLRQLNVAFPDRHLAGVPTRLKELEKILSDLPQESGFKVAPSRAQAAEFLAGYSQSNERIRAAYFPERASLFSTSLDSYPDAPSYPAFNQQQVATILAKFIYGSLSATDSSAAAASPDPT